MSSGKNTSKDIKRAKNDKSTAGRMRDFDGQYQIKMDFGEHREIRKKTKIKKSRSKVEAAAKLRDEEWEKFKREVEVNKQSRNASSVDGLSQKEETARQSEVPPQNQEIPTESKIRPQNQETSPEREEPARGREITSRAENMEDVASPLARISEPSRPSKNPSDTDNLSKNPLETTDSPASIFKPAFTPEQAPSAKVKVSYKKLSRILLITAFFAIGIWIFSGADENSDVQTSKTTDLETGSSEKPAAGTSSVRTIR